MRRLGALVYAVTLGCRAEPIDLYEQDAGIDARTLPAPCAFATLMQRDGTRCEGHDEDCDGTPDACDDCPGIANTQKFGSTVGDACRPLPLTASWARVLFDPFAGRFLGGAQSFTGSSALAVTSGDDEARGGIAIGAGSDDVPFVTFPRALGTKPVSVTSVVELRSGLGLVGLVLRAKTDGARTTFVGCVLDVAFFSFRPIRTPAGGCDGGPCALESFDTGAGAVAAKTIPFAVPIIGRPLGLRAAIRPSTRADRDELECRVFDPFDAPRTLHEDAGTEFAVAVELPSIDSPEGDVGLLAHRAAVSWRWLDVLTP